MTTPPWSRKKRLKVTVGGSALVFLAALVVGSSLYWLSQALNLTSTGSIKKRVVQQALADRQLNEAYMKALTTRGCQNQTLGFEVTFDKPIRLVDTPSPDECTKFEVVGANGKTAQILISQRDAAKEEIVRQVIASSNQVETNSIPNQHLEATSIWGLKNNLPYQAYVLARDTQKTYLIEYWPADPTGLPAVKLMAQNFNLRRK